MRRWFVISLLWLSLCCSSEKDKILPTEQALTEAVYSSVTIQPDSLYQVYAIVSGLLDVIMVEEGDLVSKNDRLFQIINNTPKINSQNAKLALNLAQENFNGSAAILKSIMDEIEAAQLKYTNDSINFYRQKNLWDQRIGSKSEYDTKKLNYQLASNQLRLLKSRYSRTKTELQTALMQAQNNYKTASIAFKDYTVNSKIDGKVYALYKEPGELVTTTQPLASIGSATRFIIELLVDEVDIVRIHLNQDVLINLDAYNDTIFKGKVSKIYPKKDERNQTFMVEAVFTEQPKVLYPGLSGEANIIIAKKENVLTIPKAYLIDTNKVKTDKGFVVIKTGLQNMDYIEILSGISKDTYIYKPE
jgi:multidrug efflux pump subunit AcrA (membrane-fusion protein)